MKFNKLITVAFFFLLNILLMGQQLDKWKYFSDFSNSQKELIEKNWVQYFENDIYDKLDTINKNVISIRLDSYGSVYPNENLFQGVNFNKTDIDRKNLIAYSIYDIFCHTSNLNIISSNIQKLEEAKKIDESRAIFYKRLVSEMNVCRSKKKSKVGHKCKVHDIDKFYGIWDSVHFAEKTNQIKLTLNGSDYKKIVFFIHGYNVPYSLANVQLLSLQREMNDSTINIKTKDILFVPIFWPSNANKNLNIKSKDDFDISNKTGLANGGIDNGILFMYYSNRAYYAAITLRELLNKLSNIKQEQFIFTHSLGATVATSALINTISKLDLKERHKSLIRNGASLEKLKNKLDAVSFDFVKGFSQPIPAQPITVFLSAPAIPGESTFCDVDSTLKDKYFFSTINPNDEMLTKDVANLPYVNRFTMSASSLGCDLVDAKRSKNIIENNNKNNQGSSFIYREVSDQIDHDILTYMNQEPYLKFIKEAFTLKSDKVKQLQDTPTELKQEFVNEYLKLESNASPYLANGKLKSLQDATNIIYLSKTRGGINTIGLPLMKIIYQAEKPTFYNKSISPITRELIHYMQDPYLIVLVERAIKEDNSIKDILFKQKVLDELSLQQKGVLSKTLPYYSYENQKRETVKFISIKSGNDLFAITTRNLDRDYTGSLLIEIGTDWLNTKRKRPLKTYQTILYGFDVFTPSFYDTLKFTSFNSFDTLDRPHASFQYFGWSKKGLSKYNRIRWQFTGKLGTIGGRAGERFQTILHQDVSNSLRPKGWDAQIANGGRLGWSIETGHEWQFYQSKRRQDRFANLNISTMLESKLGSYMTNITWGLEVSNKSFAVCNHNFIAHRVTQSVVNFLDRFTWSASIKRTYVIHNTMLEGYGILDTDEKRIDKYTPKSIYYLERNQINKWLWTGNVRVSLTTTYFTLFYNWFIFSPETKLGRLNTTDERASSIDLSKRWHHFAEIGVTFNLNRY